MSESEELKRDKIKRAYGRPCRVVLKSGETVTVDRFEMVRTYIGLIEGIPPRNHVESRIRQAENYVREHWKRPRTVVIPPNLLGATTDRPVLPTLTMMAQVSCQEPRNSNEDGSWLNFVWFADIDDQKSIKDFVESALENVDWQKEAEGYVI